MEIYMKSIDWNHFFSYFKIAVPILIIGTLIGGVVNHLIKNDQEKRKNQNIFSDIRYLTWVYSRMMDRDVKVSDEKSEAAFQSMVYILQSAILPESQRTYTFVEGDKEMFSMALHKEFVINNGQTYPKNMNQKETKYCKLLKEQIKNKPDCIEETDWLALLSKTYYIIHTYTPEERSYDKMNSIERAAVSSAIVICGAAKKEYTEDIAILKRYGIVK